MLEQFELEHRGSREARGPRLDGQYGGAPDPPVEAGGGPVDVLHAHHPGTVLVRRVDEAVLPTGPDRHASVDLRGG